MENPMSYIKLVSITAPATLLLGLAGCADNQPKADSKVDFEADPARLQAALESPILDCQGVYETCNDNAATLDERIACNDELAGCLREAADRAQSVAQAVAVCREQGRQCTEDGSDADTCRDQFEACADAALQGGKKDAGSASGPTDDHDAGVDAGEPSQPGQPSWPSLPGLPGLPGLGGVDGGVLPDLPAPAQCLIELRLCVSLDITAADQCANTARLCLQLP
jgi:hypothetical protein